MTAASKLISTDAVGLKRTVVSDGALYVGSGRSYRLKPSGSRGKFSLSCQEDGPATPFIDAIDLNLVKARRNFAERFAGERSPGLAAEIEQELRQIANMEAEAREESPSAQLERPRVPCARFEGLVDLVIDRGRVKFLLASPDASGFFLAEVTEVPGQSVLLVPPKADQLPFMVPDYSLVQEGRGKDPRRLWDAVADWIASCSMVPDGYLDLEVAFAFHTHVADRFTFSPILALVGPPEHGKTRQGKAILNVARRGVWTETPREAHVLRYADDLDATLFLDLWDAWPSIQRANIEDVILQRFERGAKVARVNDFKAGPISDTRYYSVFGPTILASNTSLPPVLMSRALPVPMRQCAAKPSRYPLEEDALPLRAALIAWRANTLGSQFAEVPVGLGGRLADLAQPLLQVTHVVAPDRLGAVVTALEEMRDLRYQRNAETTEGRVVAALVALRQEVAGGLLSVRAVCSIMNEGHNPSQCLGERQVGDVLRYLGFKTKPFGHDRRAHVLYEDAAVEELAIAQLGLERDQPEAVGTDLSDGGAL